uniref:Uncharacterized protein n=1 Tax=Anguilla anguilla TaxID=7936 RepID=A0A0E9RW00_ANGAN
MTTLRDNVHSALSQLRYLLEILKPSRKLKQNGADTSEHKGFVFSLAFILSSWKFPQNIEMAQNVHANAEKGARV